MFEFVVFFYLLVLKREVYYVVRVFLEGYYLVKEDSFKGLKFELRYEECVLIGKE